MTEAAADVVIVGAGPAGLSAATVLARAGVRVLVLDREAEAGGIPRHCNHPPYGLREFRRLMTGPAYARRLVAAARRAGAEIRTGVSVIGLRPGPILDVTCDAGPQRIVARIVLLATGVRESSRAQRLIGGSKPGGVISTGALQGMVHLAGVRPFRRPAILGTELVAFSAIVTCRAHGIRPVAMIEPEARVTARWPAALLPRLLGIALLRGTDVAAIEGEARVTGLRLTGARDRIDCDGLIVTGRFRPEATLLSGSHLRRDPLTGGPEVDSHGRLSDPAYFAAGNLLRPVETAGHCWAEGARVAVAILRALAGDLPDGPGAPVTVTGEALKWALPHRLSPGGAPMLDRITLRAARPAHGRLSLIVQGHEIAGRSLTIRPERRLSLPLPEGLSGPVEVRFTEGSGPP